MRLTSVWRAALPAMLLATIGVVCLLLAGGQPALSGLWDDHPAILVVAFVVITAVADRAEVLIEVRGQGMAFGLEEAPIALGLFLLPPLPLVCTLVAVRVVRSATAGRTRIKTAVNAALMAGDAGLAYGLAGALGIASPLVLQSWLAVGAAVILSGSVSVSCVLVIMWLTGAPADGAGALRLLAVQAASGAFSSALVLLALALQERAPQGLALLGVLVLVAIIGYRHYSSLLRDFRDLGQVEDFASALRTAQDLPLAAAQQAAALLRAEEVQLVLPQDGGHAVLELASPDADLQPAALSPYAADVLQSGAPLLTATVLVLPLSHGAGTTGALVVRLRRGGAAYGESDVRLGSALAAQLAASWQTQLRGRQLEHAALHDALTGLGNRALFSRELAAAVGEGAAAVLLLDLDRFKDVNDTLGHATGDALLVALAQRLRDVVQDRGTVARLGGDEFAVLLPAVADPRGQGEATALLVRRALEEPVRVEDLDLVVGCSIGIALVPEHGRDGGLLLSRADVAMYAAKRGERGVAVYTPALDEGSGRSLTIAADLRDAVAAGAVQVHYQPQVALGRLDLPDAVPPDAPSTYIVSGVEALARWEHPVLGWVSPEEFIRVAEHTGTIVPLTRLVLATALRDCRAWRAAGSTSGVSVNVSLRGLVGLDLVASLSALLASTGVPAEVVTLEITETSVMQDPEHALPVLQALHDLGVRLSVDDFGTGHASLSHLRRMPVDEVKVDRQFVRGVRRDDGDRAVVHAVVELGHALGLSVVAEGVEESADLAVLSVIGADCAQGYHVSRPLPFPALDAWLSAHDEARGRQPVLLPAPRERRSAASPMRRVTGGALAARVADPEPPASLPA